MNHVYIPVKDGDNTIQTTIDASDEERVRAISSSWRLSSTGYVLAVKRSDGKMVTTYLHKAIAGGKAKHINGDRLDNRRSNLLLLREDDEGVDIDVMGSPPQDIIPVYVGDMKDKVPHGYGFMATELETHVTHEIGVWEEGYIVRGIQIMYAKQCNCPGDEPSNLMCVNRTIVSLCLVPYDSL